VDSLLGPCNVYSHVRLLKMQDLSCKNKSGYILITRMIPSTAIASFAESRWRDDSDGGRHEIIICTYVFRYKICILCTFIARANRLKQSHSRGVYAKPSDQVAIAIVIHLRIFQHIKFYGSSLSWQFYNRCKFLSASKIHDENIYDESNIVPLFFLHSRK